MDSKDLFKKMKELSDGFRVSSIALEEKIPGSYQDVTRNENGEVTRVGKPQGNEARNLVRQYIQDSSRALAEAGVSEMITSKIFESKNLRAFRQALPALAMLEEKGLLRLFAFGEKDADGVTLERAIRSEFKKMFKMDKTNMRYILNMEANAGVFAFAILKGDDAILANVDKMFVKVPKSDPAVNMFMEAWDRTYRNS